MNIDRKFTIRAVNPINKKEYTEENSLLLCAKDLAVPAAIAAYQQECIKLGCSDEHIESVGLLYERVIEYQEEIEQKIPDTIGDEIDRCLHGEGVE